MSVCVYFFLFNVSACVHVCLYECVFPFSRCGLLNVSLIGENNEQFRFWGFWGESNSSKFIVTILHKNKSLVLHSIRDAYMRAKNLTIISLSLSLSASHLTTGEYVIALYACNEDIRYTFMRYTLYLNAFKYTLVRVAACVSVCMFVCLYEKTFCAQKQLAAPSYCFFNQIRLLNYSTLQHTHTHTHFHCET